MEPLPREPRPTPGEAPVRAPGGEGAAAPDAGKA